MDREIFVITEYWGDAYEGNTSVVGATMSLEGAVRLAENALDQNDPENNFQDSPAWVTVERFNSDTNERTLSVTKWANQRDSGWFRWNEGKIQNERVDITESL